jgi:hypothetical protein
MENPIPIPILDDFDPVPFEEKRPPRAPPYTKSSAFKLGLKTKNEKKTLTGKTRRKARRSAERSLTPESHLDEKVRSAETIEREQREQLATFESMLRKTKVTCATR